MSYDYNKLSVGKLDYSSIRNNLVTFLKQYPQFTNYDFDNKASAVSLFIDILSTNTAYNGYYLHSVLTNAFPRTATTKRGLLLNAGVQGAFIAESTCSRCIATVTNREATAIPRFSVFSATRSNGSPCFFYNLEEIPVTEIGSTTTVTMLGGKNVAALSTFDPDKLVLELPSIYDPTALIFSNKESNGLGAYVDVYWSQISKFSNSAIEGTSGRVFTVINGPNAYYVTTNIPGARTPTNSVTVQAIESAGALTDSAIITAARDYTNVTIVSHTVPSGGRSSVSKDYIRSYSDYAGNTKDRLVTQDDYLNAVYTFLISNNFTVTKTDIVISSPSVGEVRIYVPNLTYALQQKLMVDYLATRKMAGIVLSYGQ
jgi:hypothetical protein